MQKESIPFFGELEIPAWDAEQAFYETYPDARELFGNTLGVQMAVWLAGWERSRNLAIDECIEKVKSMQRANAND
jgi:hypothetical protein